MDFFDAFQFVMLVLFLAVFVGRTLVLKLRNGINPLVLGVGKKGLRQVIEVGFFVGLFLWLTEIIAYSLHWDFIIFGGRLPTILLDSTLAKNFGIAMITAGFVLFLLALVAFGQSWRVGIDEQNPGDLVTHGIFSISRNPIFLFIDLYFLGTFLINGSIFFLLAAGITIAGIHYQILQEEQFLTQNYGESYNRYQLRVNRYFGWPKLLNSNTGR